MTIDVPAVITSYFRASNANDVESLVACFAPDANVSDENATHRGTAEIKQWAEDVRKKFQFETEMLSAKQHPGGAIVTARLSGNFPGSPVDLDFEFVLDREKIISLVIG
jgi:ketosteroid isomerase-like protein